MNPIKQDQLREIVVDFASAIQAQKTRTAKPATYVTNFRDERQRNYERPIEIVPIGLLRYRKDNGRIASDVMNYQQLNGLLDEKDDDHQKILQEFLEKKHSEMTETLTKSIEHSGQNEPAIITCDGFLINGNRRKMVFESLLRQHPGDERYKYLKVVILPGRGEPGGPPSLLEIEHLENRYQLQSDGKSEYYGFDRALSIRRKIDLGFPLEEQLRDDPRYVRASEQELKKAIKEYEKEFVWPVECIDRYLHQFNREGMYGTISTGKSDSEGRWQAFIDYSGIFHTKLNNAQWRNEHGIEEGDVGAIEEAAFKIIRLRALPGLPKIHQIMRALPKICALKESRKEVVNIANEIDSNLPQNDQFDAQGNELSLDVIDKKWAHLHQQKLIMFTKKALDFVDATAEKETPLTLLEAALKKLTHEDFVVENIPHAQYQKARELASNIQVLAKDIEHQLYNNEKKKNDLTRKK